MTPDQTKRHALHLKEFKSRGISDTEAKRLADAVLAREEPGASTAPLTLKGKKADQ